jgi:hypothetical protein
MVDADCKCHLMIEDYSVETQHGMSVKCAFSVLASTSREQVGKKHTEFFPCEGKAVDKFYNLAEAAGLITADQRKNAAAQGVGLEVDETLLKGRQLCCEIKMEPNMRRNAATGATEIDPEKPGPYPRIGFRTFAVTSDKAKDVPKDPQFLALLGKQAGAVTQPQQPAPAATAPPATSGGGMDW